MKRWWWGVVPVVLAACSSAAGSPRAETSLRDFGPAPELTNTVWLNADRPLRLADLRGQVVLIDFWTFG